MFQIYQKHLFSCGKTEIFKITVFLPAILFLYVAFDVAFFKQENC